MRRVGLLVIPAAMLTCLLPTAHAAAHTTGGSALPSNDGPHAWKAHPSDELACSMPLNIPQEPAFNHACKHHDGCYEGFPRDGEPTHWVSRLQCDDWFRADMTESCVEVYGLEPLSQCMAEVTAYYAAVRVGGRNGFHGPDNN